MLLAVHLFSSWCSFAPDPRMHAQGGSVREPLLGPQPTGEVSAGTLAAPQARHENVLRGMLWYGASSFFFAGMGICSKLLGGFGYPVWEITFFRAIVITCFALSAIISSGTPPSYQSPRPLAATVGHPATALCCLTRYHAKELRVRVRR
jgi:hypothetical protein